MDKLTIKIFSNKNAESEANSKIETESEENSKDIYCFILCFRNMEISKIK